MTKLMLVVMELIILIILIVYANDPTPLSSAPTPLPTNLHPFRLDNEYMTYIHLCLETTLKKCDIPEESNIEFCIAKNLLGCLFNHPMHPKDYPISLGHALGKCHIHCLFDSRSYGISHAQCIADCYEDQMKKH
jgi:hypothetical protein